MTLGAYLLLFVFIGGPLLVWARCMAQKQPEASIFQFGGGDGQQHGCCEKSADMRSAVPMLNEQKASPLPIPSRKAMADAKNKMAREIRDRVDRTENTKL